jgi:predicted Zn-dependent peptidase
MKISLQRCWQCLLTVWLTVVLIGSGGVAQAQALTPSPQPSIQPYLEGVIKRITEFRLDNGMKFIVLERHQAPVVSFLTYANVGGANEPDGQTGVAHYLEHLAFKGTTRIGTRDYAAEKKLLEYQDQLFEKIQQAKATQQTAQLQHLQQEFERVSAEAMQYVQPNRMAQIVEQAGGVGLNANTSADATRYFYGFPSNKLELWMSLESDRFLEPVFREFFQEKEVILEERRTRSENSPLGRMIEAFLDKAFVQHPYQRPVIGYTQDIQNLTRCNVQDFFKQYYAPNNLTMAIVGDVNPAEVKRLAQIYFGRYPAQPQRQELEITEPPQTEPREVSLQLNSQPWYLEGYHIPAMNHPDYPIYELTARLLSDGRTSRLYKTLVQDQRVALAAEGSSGFPGDKYPNLMLFYAQTAPGHTLQEVETALRAEIERLKTDLVAPDELDRVRTQARAALLRSLDSNMGMAQLLLDYEVKAGSWRKVFQELDQLAKITPADIQRIAKATFTPQNLTVGRLRSRG